MPPCTLDADRIADNLYQGSRPPVGPQVRDCGFDVLVLTAEEYQPPAEGFPGVRVVHAGYDDAGRPITESEWRTALRASKIVAIEVRRGARVLVTCHMGLNRSGLVSALALHYLTGMAGSACARVVRHRRPGALRNPSFSEVLSRVGPRAVRRPVYT